MPPRRFLVLCCAVALPLFAKQSAAIAQSGHLERLSADPLDATPTSRVTGVPGSIVPRPRACRPLPQTEVGRRIVNLAVQEWGFFGFPVRDEAGAALEWQRATATDADADADRSGWLRGFFPRLDDAAAARVATTVAGYWAVTPEAVMMVNRLNASWREGDTPRRGDPWSAAFISWVMCEAGLAEPERFQRAIAHHSYIDQAIRARQGSAPAAAFVAYDAGEAAIAPGDLLCAARRPVYRTLAERRRQMGEGARTHCDVVVRIDASAGRVLAVGGNVGRAVSLKNVQAFRGRSGHLQAAALDEGRPVFAHLKLRGTETDAHAFDNSPTIRALTCRGLSAWPEVARLLPAAVRC